LTIRTSSQKFFLPLQTQVFGHIYMTINFFFK